MNELKILTHVKASRKLIGEPVEVKTGEKSVVKLSTDSQMCVDLNGLIHGGFTFSLADYAAMLAVNHPYVVLGSASVKFIAPVTKGEVMYAEAKVIRAEGRKTSVSVEVTVNDKIVFNGEFICYSLDKHVLENK